MTSSDEALEKQGKCHRNSCSSAQRAGAPCHLAAGAAMAGTQPARPGPARGAPRDPWGHPSGQHPAYPAWGSLASETALQLSPTDRLPSFFPLVYFSSYRAYYQAFCTVNAVSGLKPIEPAPTQAQPGTPRKLRACQLQPQARAQATHGTGSRLLLALWLPLLPGDVLPVPMGP